MARQASLVVVEKPIAEFSQTRAAATGDDLVEGVERVEASTGTLVSISPARQSGSGWPTNRGVFGGATPFRSVPGGIARVTWPGVWNEPVADGANSLWVFTLV